GADAAGAGAGRGGGTARARVPAADGRVQRVQRATAMSVGRVPGPLAPRAFTNAMSVDVEDYFQVQAFAGVVDRADWDGFASRVEANTDRILAQFAAAGAKGTFFTLGWVAERHPALVRR